MGFFDFLKPSNLLTLGGAFLPIPGGPFLGAALGGGLGSALEGENVLEGAAGGAAMAGIGKGISALTNKAGAAAAPAMTGGGGSLSTYAGPKPAAAAGTATPNAAATAAQGGGGGFMGAMSPMEKMFLGSQALGTLSNMYSSYQQGRIEDDRQRRREALARALAPYLVDALPRR